MDTSVHPHSLLGRIQALVPDPRSRRGRVYPLRLILGMLLLGALEGEGSLRGMWMRGKKYWALLAQQTGEMGLPHPPALTTVWYMLKRIDVKKLGEALSGWVGEDEALSVDGKYLRGSRRSGEMALHLVTVAGQKGGQILAQCLVERGQEGAAAVALLSEMPLKGRVVSLDAGLMERPVIRCVREKGGTTSGC